LHKLKEFYDDRWEKTRSDTDTRPAPNARLGDAESELFTKWTLWRWRSGFVGEARKRD
jgi:hypothetical protein